MTVELVKVKDYNEMSAKACSIILEMMEQEKNPVLGLATGSTPEGLYQEFIHQYNVGNVSFSNVTTFNLDEYVGLSVQDPNSYHYYMKDKLFHHIDINLEQVNIPNGRARDLEQECLDYERKIKESGHIDIQVLGLGLNGHIGFNEPGTAFSSRTHVVKLAESTRKANSRFFSKLEQVPREAITMGIETIMQAKKILLLVSGEKKSNALTRLIEGEVSEDFPASILKHHPNVVVLADTAAW